MGTGGDIQYLSVKFIIYRLLHVKAPWTLLCDRWRPRVKVICHFNLLQGAITQIRHTLFHFLVKAPCSDRYQGPADKWK